MTRSSGRNANGRITSRHRGGGHKRRYRLIDFRRGKDGVPGRVLTIEYDPNRSAYIALVVYADGERVGAGRARFRVVPGALTVLVPDDGRTETGA